MRHYTRRRYNGWLLPTPQSNETATLQCWPVTMMEVLPLVSLSGHQQLHWSNFPEVPLHFL